MPLQVAFYGAGPPAEPYLRDLARRPDVQIAAVCDPNPRTAELAAAGWGARVFADPAALFAEARPAALWVCVPAALQGDVLRRAAAQNVPFFVEPPGAVDYAQACEFARLVREANLVTAVGHRTRFVDVLTEARQYLGDAVAPLALGWWLCPPAEGVPAGSDLPPLWGDACRLVDALRFFCGEATRVRALAAGAGLVAQVEFVRGNVGTLTCAAFDRPQPRAELELLGEGWTMLLGDRLTTLHLAERDRTTILRGLNDPAEEQVSTFLKAVEAGQPEAVPCPYADALRTLAVCQAIAVSLREGRAVALGEIAVG